MSNGTERRFIKAMNTTSCDADFIKDYTGTWIDKHQGIDCRWNGLFIDTTGKVKKDRVSLKSIGDIVFENPNITGFIKRSNGHIMLKTYVLVLEFNECNYYDMLKFCTQLPEIQDLYYNAIDLWEETNLPKRDVSSSYWESKYEPA